MNLKYKIICTLLVLNIIIVCAGCSNGDNMTNVFDKNKIESDVEQKETDIVLNERQLEILKEKGLPMNYEELSISQKNAIVAINDMLEYLEEKYKMKFSYVSYIAAMGVEAEQLTACIESDTSVVVTVYRYYKNKEYVYSDNYQKNLIVDDYRKLLERFFENDCNLSKFWVDVTVNDIKEISNKKILECTGTSNHIFVTGISEKELAAIVTKYDTWMKSYDLEFAVITAFILQNSEDYGSTNLYNYVDQINNEAYEKYITWSVSKNGRVLIY